MASFTFSPASLRLALVWSVRPWASSSSSSVARPMVSLALPFRSSPWLRSLSSVPMEDITSSRRPAPRSARPNWSGDPAAGRPVAVDAPGRDQEAGVADHAVLGADGQPVDVPGAEDGLRGLDQPEAARPVEGLDQPHDLGDGGDEADQDPARLQGRGRATDDQPRLQQVEQDPVDRAELADALDDVALVEGEAVGGLAEPALDVAPRPLGEVGAALEGMQPAPGGEGLEQGDR